MIHFSNFLLLHVCWFWLKHSACDLVVIVSTALKWEEGEKLFPNVSSWHLKIQKGGVCFCFLFCCFLKVMLEGLFKTLGFAKCLFPQTIQILC